MGILLYNRIREEKEKVLRVVKTTDGKIFEYKRAMLVQDILVNFSGYAIGLSKKLPLQDLPYNYKLKIGNLYYLFPISSSIGCENHNDDDPIKTSSTTGSTKRIKLIITKQELEELLSRKISIEEMCLQMGINFNKKDGDDGNDDDDDDEDDDAWHRPNYSSSRWQPVLETIPEESSSDRE